MFSFLRRNFRWIAGGFLLTYFSSFGQTFFIAGSIREWQSAFALSHGEIGRLYMLATLCSAICLPFLGRLVDILPAHRVILIVVPLLSGAALLAAFAPSVLALTMALFLLRLFGQGMMTHTALTATGRWFEADRGRAVSLVVLGHQGGEATLPLLFAAVAVAAGYQVGWVVSAAALLFVGLPLAWWAYRVPHVPRRQMPSAATDQPVKQDWQRGEVLRDPVFWLLLIGVLAPPFVGTTIFYHQDYLTELRGWSPQHYARALSLAALTTVCFALICGALVDRVRATAILPYFLLPLGASCFVLSIDGAPALLYLVMFLLGIAYGLSSTLFGALWPELYGVTHLGAIRSVTVSAAVLATAAGPGITGSLIDLGITVPQQMTWIGAYCLAAALVMTSVALFLRRRRGP